MQNYLDLINKMDYTKLNQPAEMIKNGSIVIFPTETVYGRCLFKIKKINPSMFNSYLDLLIIYLLLNSNNSTDYFIFSSIR